MAAQILASTTKLTRSYCHTPCQRPFCGKTIAELFDITSDRYPDREAITQYSENAPIKRVTFGELRRQIDGLASGLIKLGLQRGEMLGIFVGRRYEYIVAYLGAIKAGLVVVRHYTLLRAEQLAQQINRVGCVLIVTDDMHLGTLREVIPGLEECSGVFSNQTHPNVRFVVNIDAAERRGVCLPLDDVIDSSGVESKLENIRNEIQPDDPAVIVFTSGSTGPSSKIVVHSHHALAEMCMFFSEYNAAAHCGRPGCYLLSVGGYAMSFEAFLASMVVTGERLVQTESTSVDAYLRAIEQESCTSLFLYPLPAHEIVNFQNEYNLSSLTVVSVAGNNVPQATFEKLKGMLTPNVHNVYGATEVGQITYHDAGDPVEGRIETVGRPLPHSEIKIVDKDLKIVPINTQGEICVRGPTVFKYYLGDDDNTKKRKTDSGWFFTGDLGIMLEDGRIRHLGRKDECILRNDAVIYPFEIEMHVIGHSKVKLCQAVGVPDEKMIQEICLCVVLQQETQCTQEEIIGPLKETLDQDRIPKYFLIFESFPNTMTGKIKRKELERMAVERLNLQK